MKNEKTDIPGGLALRGIASSVTTVGEALSPDSQKLVPFLVEVIRTSPRDNEHHTSPEPARAPQYVGKPVDAVVVSKK